MKAKEEIDVLTPSGVPVKMYYTPHDTASLNYENELNDPGKFPFTRGIHEGMYRTRLWTMRQYAGYGSASETNARFHLLLKEGQSGLSTAFDLPTQMGYDPNDPEALGEVGRVGVSIPSLSEMERLFEGIPLDKVSTSMTINATASILLALYLALGEKQGISTEKLSGTLQNDILKEYIARGTYIFPIPFSMRLVVDTIEYCVKFLPKMNPISISGYHMREAGATAVEEVAFTFANALAYLKEAQKRGLSVEEVASRFSFFFACHNDFFEEIAKFRVARKIWARLLSEKLKVTDRRALLLRFHTQTAGSTLTSQQPLNNVVRVALQALAAVLGGTQSLHTNAYDEALALPTEASALLALRTQQIIAYESGATACADPLGGSYYLESLTLQLEEKIWELLREVEKRGGAEACVVSGYFQQAIQQSAYEYQKKLESKEAIVVGVNAFKSEKEIPIPVLKINPDIEKEAVERIKKLKKERSSHRVKEVLNAIQEASKKNENLIPYFVGAVKVQATLGEICHALREIHGTYDALS
jgi:methylmalonyl-CoA mutase N-terminal domain/subunit